MIELIKTNLRRSIVCLGLTLILVKVFYFDLLNWINILVFLPLAEFLALTWLSFLLCGFFSIAQCFRQRYRQIGILSSLLWIGLSLTLLWIDSTKADFYQNQTALNIIASILETNLQEGEYVVYTNYQQTPRANPILETDSQKSNPRMLTQLKLPVSHRFKNIFASKYQHRILVSVGRFCWGIIFSCIDGRYVYLSHPQTRPYQQADICPQHPDHCINLSFVNAPDSSQRLTSHWYWSENYDG